MAPLEDVLTKPCHDAALLLAASSMFLESAPPLIDQPYPVLAYLTRSSCRALRVQTRPRLRPRPRGRFTSVRGTSRSPRKTRNVPPVYPRAALEERRQGQVVIESTIYSSGCMGGARVLRSPDTRLSWAALRAVAKWRYTPTLLDGVPVPVIMTVTVNFRNQLMRKRDVVPVVAALLALAACGGGSSPARPAAVATPDPGFPVGATLSIRSGATDSPVPGASVVVAGTVYTTDIQGEVRLTQRAEPQKPRRRGGPGFL